MTDVHFVVPDGIDDPARPTGGNSYDRHLSRGLAALGWAVHEHAVPGFWGVPDAASFAALESAVRQIPGGALVLIDGLVASTAPDVLLAQARRLRLVVLVHMPLATDAEGAALSAAAAVVTTSTWTRRVLIERYALTDQRVRVAEPGADAASLATGSARGAALLCVAAVTPVKGHDLLLDALATMTDLSWKCVCVGSLDRDPAFAKRLRRRSQASGLGDRVSFSGTRTGTALERSYDGADLLVVPSRLEAYGMVVTEALARGVPAVATDVGGVSEALGHGHDGRPPGLLVPPNDPAALAAALREWLGSTAVREQLRDAARERRGSLPDWQTTASVVGAVLVEASR